MIDRSRILKQGVDSMAREGIVVLVVVTCLVTAVAGTLQDGLPRPTNIVDEPFKSHGPLPEAKYPNGTVANCKWYGFRNTMYSERIVTACVNELRTALADSSLELILEPFAYYYLAGDVGADPATDERYCYEGCFDIDSGSHNSPAPSPGGNFLEATGRPLLLLAAIFLRPLAGSFSWWKHS